MNPVLLLPLGLAALAAWLVPLLIHLRRRNEEHRTEFAALRWLKTGSQPRSRVRFDEWPLLLLRLLLLTLVALLLAQPAFYESGQRAHWQVFAPGVDPSAAGVRADGGSERRWLAPGFPGIDTPAPKQAVPVGSLLRELDAILPADTSLTVFVPTWFDGADATAPTLHRPVQWKIVSNTDAASSGPQRQAATPPRPMLAVRHDTQQREGLRYLRASAIAWQARAPATPTTRSLDIATVDRPLPPTDRPLAWLAPGPLPSQLRAWIEDGGTVLVGVAVQADAANTGTPLWRDAEGTVLVRGVRLGRGRLLQWTKPLTPQAMPELLEPEFPEQLWKLFAPPDPAPTRVGATDYAPRTGGAAYPQRPRDLQSWLLVLIAGLFLVERWVASGRRERTVS